MTPAYSLTQTRKPFCNRTLWVEHLEDRLVPGETLTGLLLLPAGLLSVQELAGEPVAASEDPSAISITETSSAADCGDGLLADGGEGDLSGNSATFSFFDRSGPDSQTPEPSPRSDEPTSSVADLLFPQAGPAGDLGGGGWEFLPEFVPGPAPKSLAGGTVDMNNAAGRADPLVPAPLSLPGTTNLAGPAPGAVAGDVGSVTEAASSPAMAYSLLQTWPTGRGGGGHGGGGGGTPSGYSPAQIRHAYGFDQLTQNGTGVTIAVVDAYDDPNIQSDLDTFSTQFGLATTSSGQFTFTKAYAQGSKPVANGGWAQEISLDVEWAHAIAPRANILLVEAANNSLTNLMGAVDYAVNQGAHIVSMSWGASDFSGESTYDSHFNVPGVTFLASAGDTGGQVLYPSASPYVVSVGGTTLPLNSSGNLTGAESAWSSGGGGPSANETEPAYQTGYGITVTGGQRGTPDVAYDANPYTGFAVYDSYAYQGRQGWLVFGGTSAGAPQWAGLVALADQTRSTFLASSNLTSSPVYSAATGSIYTSNYRDIASGSNSLYKAGTEYDLATGLGSPLANSLVPYLATQ